MHYIQGSDRGQEQLLPPTIEEYVAAEAAVRVVDAFVDSLDLAKLGFVQEMAATGRPAYHPGVLLKLYLYGYMHGVRSSRRLEAECGRNLEVIWLMRQLRPDHWTIATFRREHRERFKAVMREFTVLCRNEDLFGAELVAIDGAKFKAVNSRDRLYSAKQLQIQLREIDERIDQYLTLLETADHAEQGVAAALRPEQWQQALARMQQRREEYAQLSATLAASGREHIAETDPDSTAQKKVGVGYNVQIAVDAKHHLIVAETVCQDANDVAQLAPMASAAQAEIGVNKATADGGYHSGVQLQACEAAGIETYVAARGGTGRTNRGEMVYPKEQFKYDSSSDTYLCPAGQALARVSAGRKHGVAMTYYANPAACGQCPRRSECTTAAYRRLGRSVYEAAVERQAERLQRNREPLRLRRCTVEHVFGSLRLWHHDTFLCRGLAMVRAEFTLSALSYNFRRALRACGASKLLAALTTA